MRAKMHAYAHMEFEAPQKQTNGSFLLCFKKPVEFPVELRWERGAQYPTPDLRIQPHINQFREKTLRDLSKNKVLFKTAPSVSSLTSIAPMWGLLVQGGALEWSNEDHWTPAGGVLVHLVATAILISRQSIVPCWTTKTLQVLPDKAQLIDLDFGGEEEDEDKGKDKDKDKDKDEGESVHSDDLEAEEGVVNLKNPDERKRVAKQQVRALMERAVQARLEADAAVDRFFSEFDLSEEESDFSEYEEDD